MYSRAYHSAQCNLIVLAALISLFNKQHALAHGASPPCLSFQSFFTSTFAGKQWRDSRKKPIGTGMSKTGILVAIFPYAAEGGIRLSPYFRQGTGTSLQGHID